VTFLFTDVEGSTRLWEESPEAMRAALAAHDGVMLAAIEGHDGYVFSTAGDAFSAAFWTPGDALAAAVEAQRGLAAEGWREPVVLRVRMGLHTGTAEERGGDYFGPAVNRAARLMAVAYGGQVLVSSATQELLRDRQAEDVTLVDLGGHALKGLARPERVFQVCAPGLATPFPPLRTARTLESRLPTPATSFVGRADELKRLAAELPGRRLITLTGVGGVGKTRLAVAAAWLAAEEFPDGLWLCELAPIADPASVAHTVSATLSIPLQEGLSMVDSVVDALGGRRLLLVLDNCEHVLDAAAELAGRIVELAPTVSVLATSREPLGVAGEQVWLVRSLDPTSDGAELFRDRASGADAAFSPSDHDRTVISGICERLDGIPLAIELAAARVRTMTVADLAGRLEDRFGFLRGGRRGVERHQTLRATVQWSYRLLDDTERLLFDRLSVFAGGFDLVAARAVCADERVDLVDIDDVLDGLVDKSMVVADRAGAHVRYRLLETLRQFGEERLDEHDELAGLRDRHLDHYARLAERTRQIYEGHAHVQGAAIFRAEWDNLRAAMHQATARADAARASQILRALLFFAHQDVRHEIGDWADQFIESARATTMIYGVAGYFAGFRGDHDRALRQAETGLSLATTATSPGAWVCWDDAVWSNWYSGRADEAFAAARAQLDALDPEREPFAAAHAAAVAIFQACSADRPAADRYVERLQELATALDNPAVDMSLHYASATVEQVDGRLDAAVDHLRLALALVEQIGNRAMGSQARLSLAFLAMASDPATAHAAFEDALTHLYANREWSNLWVAIEALAIHWTETGRTEPAATLLGFLEARKDLRSVAFLGRRQDAVAALRESPEAHPWMAQGAALDRDQLVDYALDQLADAIDKAPVT
jgi:predicted ATPase/class 3 adenylate cyclase